jgi:hypothetical protein
MKQQHFWNVDLWVVLQAVWRDLVGLGMALYVFFFLSLPVVIPTLILWWLLSINYGGNR